MKKILKEYVEETRNFFTNTKYIIPIIFVAILSYGFAITHYAIGVDDLCFDRYVSGTYILSAKRWGTWLLYNILHITEFSPFWLEFIVATFMVIIATLICAFISKNLKNKISICGYVIFSAIFISNPIINHFFMYQSTNLSIVISNLIVIISAIIIMENYYGNKKKIIYIISSILLTFAISMYESCAQTFLVMLFGSIFIKIINKEEKNIYKYFFTSISCLVIAVFGYWVTGKLTLFILEFLGLKENDYALSGILWTNKKFWRLSNYSKIKNLDNILFTPLIYDTIHYYPMKIMVISSFVVLVVELIKSYKINQNNRLFVTLAIIFSNFILIIVQVKLLYRTQFSWILTVAFFSIYIYKTFENKKILKNIISILFVFLIIYQTRYLSQLFYEDYQRYEKDKIIANSVAIDIVKNTDYENKPIMYIKELKNTITTTNLDTKSIIDWGLNAFNEKGTEITKFINNFGYEFIIITEEQYIEAKKQYDNLDEKTKNQNIIELENYIIVNLEKYE